MKMYKMLFVNLMIIGSLMSISAYSWFSMWMGLEINLLSIIPLFMAKNNLLSSESSLKYFITQALASLILLMAVVMLLMNNEFIAPQMNSHFSLMMNSALLMKLGAAPFHFWFPEVMEGLNWTNCLILLSWQKIAPFMLMMNNKINKNFLITIIIFSLIISATMAFNQISLRKIMAFSSINHIAWMLSSLMISFSAWFIYFIIYILLNFNIIIMFMKTNSFFIKQLKNTFNHNKLFKFTMMSNFLSLGGLPPFIGFLPKWILINWLTNEKMFTIVVTMIVTTLIMLFIYIRIMLSAILLSHSESKINSTKLKSSILIFINISSILLLTISTLLFNLM